MTIVNVTSENFTEETSNILVLVTFWSSWCEPCKMIHTILEKIDNEMNDKVKIVKVEIDENEELARRFDVIGTPTLVLLKQGESLEKLVGYQTKDVVTKLLEKYM